MTPEEGFGQVLRELRQERGLTQDELAEATGCHRAHVSFLERGRKSPTLHMIYQLSAALGVTVPAVVARVDELLRGVASASGGT